VSATKPPPPPIAAPLAASSPPGKLVLSPGWIVFAALALAIPLVALFARSWAAPPRLPVLATLPDFALTDQRSQPFARKDLLGRVWVADFVFTHCAEACPRLTQKMRSIQDQLTAQEAATGVGLLSVSVDPERDTPEVLQRYAQAFGARDQLWRFLTGPQTAVEKAVVQGFKIAMVKAPLEGQPPPAQVKLPGQQGSAAPLQGDETPDEIHARAFDIMHGEKFVLVDAQARIRGYYDVTEAEGLQRLIKDLRLLVRGGA
jgi:protein SCO1